MGVVTTKDDIFTVVFAPRSSVASLQEETKLELLELSSILGFEATVDSEYPGWSYAKNSPVRDKFIECYRELFNKKLKIEAIHAGLECGIFSEKLKGLDAIAIGPTVIDCHTPKERLDLASCEKVWKLVTKVLKKI